MNTPSSAWRRRGTSIVAVVCAFAIGRADALAAIWLPVQAAPQTTASQDALIPADQLDSLVAPIALYPDPLLAQTLAASTYPLEIMQLRQWLTRNPNLKGKALADAVARQPWDPSVQAMAALPDVVTRLSDDIQWTTDLGNAFLAQESDVMNAVQRMRQKAEGTGNLRSTEQQVVETRVIENKEVIVIEQASPEVVYVPSYNPVAVYGEPVYPYPAIHYPSAGYYAAGAAISFGVGVAMGAFWGGGGWGWGAGWGRNDININRNANFVRNSNFYRGGNLNTWQHNAVHRGGAAYGNRTTAARYGGAARGQAYSNRSAAARQQLNRQGGQVAAARSGAVGARPGTVGARPGTVGARSGAVGTSGRSFSGSRQQFNSGSVNRGNFNSGSVNRGNFSSGSVNRGNFSSRSGSGNFKSNRGSYSGNRGSFSGGKNRSFSGSRGGGRSFGGGGGGRRGGGGGRRR
jgi:hypothetical protein